MFAKLIRALFRRKPDTLFARCLAIHVITATGLARK